MFVQSRGTDGWISDKPKLLKMLSGFGRQLIDGKHQYPPLADQRAFNMQTDMMRNFNLTRADDISIRVCGLIDGNMPIREAL